MAFKIIQGVDMKTYSYVIATDAGVAPNFESPMPTLAICKPKIRLGAEPGNLVIGFTGKQISPEPHGVCWAGVVAKKQTFAEYWTNPNFDSKKPSQSEVPDNIYKPVGGDIVQVSNSSHGPGNASRDIGGQYVLAFEPSWYFGSAAPILPSRFGLRLVGGRRGHRVVELSKSRWQELKKWLNDQEREIEILRPRSVQTPKRQAWPKTCS